MDICIDFDGTCTTHSFPEVGKEIGAAPVLRKLVEAGHNLILFTMRANVENNTGFSEEVPTVHNGKFLDEAVAWFDKHELPLYGVQRNPTQDSWTSSPKAYGQLYVDDAALGCPLRFDPIISDRPFVDWYEVEKHLVKQGII